MSTYKLRLSVLTLGASSFALVRLDARPQFVARVPNANSIAGVQALGHRNAAGGGALNPFGTAFEAQGAQWTTALCQADSDGDGATNGEELGDPCCRWAFGGQLQRTGAQVSHPGVANAWTHAQVEAMTCQEAAVNQSGGGGEATAPVTSAPPVLSKAPLHGAAGRPSGSIDSGDDDDGTSAIATIDPAGLKETPPSLLPQTPSPTSAHAKTVTPTPTPTSASSTRYLSAVVAATAVIVFGLAL